MTATGAPAREGVWTLDLQSWRPLHPNRLRAQIEQLSLGPMRGRGHFWLPTRPGVACGWDGAGGQLSIGDVGRWPGQPDTHMIVTGVGGDPTGLLAAFDSVLMTDAELVSGLLWWAGRPDGLDPWLGVRRGAA